MFPHVVTVFNVWEDDDLGKHYNITILRGVLLDISKGANIAKTGLSDADAATLYIPFIVTAESTTGDVKRYKEPKAFYAADNPGEFWTLDSGGESSSTSTYFAKGEISEQMSLKELRQAHEYVYDVSTVDIRDFGGDMAHWQVGGK